MGYASLAWKWPAISDEQWSELVVMCFTVHCWTTTLMIGVICCENSGRISKAFWLFFVKIPGRQAKAKPFLMKTNLKP